MKNFTPYYRLPRREPLPLPKSFENPSLIAGYQDCGSRQEYGICRSCGKAHGYVIRLTAPLP
jgi:hypothetical protein